jgi:hypothetical protein
MLKRIREFENLHVALWLFKDLCWISDYKTLGVVMIMPTILLAIIITWVSRDTISDLMHNLAVCFWIMANSTWMIGEFFYEDGTRPYAKVFFFAGILCVAIYYLYFLPKKLKQEKEQQEQHQ